VIGIGAALAQAQQAPDAADRTAIREVIARQLAAFLRDDGAEAFSYASPEIQRLFGGPEAFMAMVRDGYRPVYRPREYEFRPLDLVAGRLVQPVLVVGPDGVPVLALYFMERQPGGEWRIGGCTLTTVDDKAV
jgi:hypothetical protein